MSNMQFVDINSPEFRKEIKNLMKEAINECKDSDDNNKLLSREEAAEKLNIKDKKSWSQLLNRMTYPQFYDPPLKYVQVGKEKYFYEKDIEEFIETRHRQRKRS